MRSFFNLDYYADLIRGEIAIPGTGLWCVVGFPEELSNIKSNRKGLLGAVYFEPDPAHFESNGYDYYDFDFRSPHSGRVPSSLGGMSGGGVWHVRLLQDATTGEVKIPEERDWLILSGLVFYQSQVSDGGRDLRAHGRKSIYAKLFEWA